MDCADYRIHSDCTADSTGYNLLYGLSPYSVTISPCKSITLSRGFWFQQKKLLQISRSAEATLKNENYKIQLKIICKIKEKKRMCGAFFVTKTCMIVSCGRKMGEFKKL